MQRGMSNYNVYKLDEDGIHMHHISTNAVFSGNTNINVYTHLLVHMLFCKWLHSWKVTMWYLGIKEWLFLN